MTAMGDAHVDVLVEQLKRKFGASVRPAAHASPTGRRSASRPRSITAQAADRRPRAFGHVVIKSSRSSRARLRVRRQDRRRLGAEAVHPRRREGLRETLAEGVLAGYPVVDLAGRLVDGSYHTVDSSEMAFKRQRQPGPQARLPRGRPSSSRSWRRGDRVPEAYMGDVMGQITAKRGHVMGMDSSEAGCSTSARGAPGGDVPLRDRAAQHHPGPRPLQLGGSTTTRRCRARSRTA